MHGAKRACYARLVRGASKTCRPQAVPSAIVAQERVMHDMPLCRVQDARERARSGQSAERFAAELARRELPSVRAICREIHLGTGCCSSAR